MTRAYTISFYRKITELYKFLPAKMVAAKLQCSISLVYVAKHRLKAKENERFCKGKTMKT